MGRSESNALHNPWLALSSYEEKDSYRFKGRDDDIDKLLTMIEQNEVVTCYAASGEGKTSLINAGICPMVRMNGLFPIRIVFTANEFAQKEVEFAQEKVDFDTIIKKKIDGEINKHNIEFKQRNGDGVTDKDKSFQLVDGYKSLPDGLNKLWWKLRTEEIVSAYTGRHYIPLLIFDQFEEIFRAKWKQQFFTWLEKLMRDVRPDEIAKELAKEYDRLPQTKLFKALFSLRYEYIGELDYWCSQKSYIPLLMRNRYFLRPLTREQAISVINDQGAIDGDQKANNVLNDVKKIRNAIVDIIIEQSGASVENSSDEHPSSDTIDEVPAVILSLMCYVLYDEWYDSPSSKFNDIDIKRLVYDYYLGQIEAVGINDNQRSVIEEELISPDGKRLRVYAHTPRLQRIGFESILDALVARHIIRKYSITGDDYVELVHDRLASVVSDGHKKGKELLSLQGKQLNKSKLMVVIASVALLVLGFVVSFISVSPTEAVSRDSSVRKNDVTLTDADIGAGTLVDENLFDSATSLAYKGSNDSISSYGNVIYYKSPMLSNYASIYWAKNAEILTFARGNPSFFYPTTSNKKVYFLWTPDSSFSVARDLTDKVGTSEMQDTINLGELVVEDGTHAYVSGSEPSAEADSTVQPTRERLHVDIYVPYGTLNDRLLQQESAGVHFLEMSRLETFYRRLCHSYCDAKTPIGLPGWAGAIVLTIIIWGFICLYFRDKLSWKSIFILAIVAIVMSQVLFIFSGGIVWQWGESIRACFLCLVVMCFTSIILGITTLLLTDKSSAVKESLRKSKLSIVYCSQEGKSWSQFLRQKLKEKGLNIRIETRIVSSDRDDNTKDNYNSNVCRQEIDSSKHCIAILTENDLKNVIFGDGRLSQYGLDIMSSKKCAVHPFIIGLDSLNNTDLPYTLEFLKKKRPGRMAYRPIFMGINDSEEEKINQMIETFNQLSPKQESGCYFFAVLLVLSVLLLFLGFFGKNGLYLFILLCYGLLFFIKFLNKAITYVKRRD